MTSARNDRPKTTRRGTPQRELTCKEAVSFLSDYLEDELDPALRERFEKHLAGCPWCVDFLATFRKSIELSREIHYEQLPVNVRRRVESFLKKNLRTGR